MKEIKYIRGEKMNNYEVKAVDGTLYIVNTKLGVERIMEAFTKGEVVRFESDILINLSNVISIRVSK